MTLVERFLKYVSFPTTSGEDREGKCSTDGQYVLAEELKKRIIRTWINRYLQQRIWNSLFYFKRRRKFNHCIAGTYGYLSFSKWRKYQATYN